MLPWEDASSAGPGRFHSTLMFGQFFFCVCVCLFEFDLHLFAWQSMALLTRELD